MAASGSSLSQILVRIFGSRNERMIQAMLPLVEQVNHLEPKMAALSDTDLRRKTDEFRDRLTHGETLDDLLPEAFAVVREASRRVIWTPDPYDPRPMRHFDVQLIGGIVLHRGMIAEMATGEGKTLVANLAAYLNALTGKGVHVVTVNDYLARRDCAWMGPMFELLGMTAGAIQSDQDYEEKKRAYACDITYGTASEFGFDYLRDNMRISVEQQVQRYRYFAIVDEVDCVLIDEARTPLIISGPAEESTEKYYEADRIATRLQKDVHYKVKEKERQAHLTEAGVAAVERLLGVESIYSGPHQDWPHHIEQALVAHNLYKRDVHYVVKGGEVIIVDEFTGRLQPGRRWSDGLHQAIEAKEHLRIKEENQTLATITYQNYFRLYEKLAGMTGTAMTEAEEFMKIYGLDVVSIPTNRPLIRREYRDVVFRTQKEKFDAIEEEIVEQHATGRPLLVGTISIEKSELLSERLKRRGIKHEVLNAKYHEREAQIVAKAGQLGTVTIATNMAGRGTDIVLGRFTEDELLDHWQACGLIPKNLDRSLPRAELEQVLMEHWAQHYLDPETLAKTPRAEWPAKLQEYWRRHDIPPLRLCTSVAELGGLHIIGTERHEARRIDNQLRGRAGRQGDPGSSRFFLSLEDDLMRIFAPERVSNILKRLGMTEGMAIEHRLLSRSIERAQKKVEEHNFEIRKHLLEYDEIPNEQRKAIYGMRQRVLEEENLKPMVLEMIEQGIHAAVDRALPGDEPPEIRNFRPLHEWARQFGVEITEEQWRTSSFEALEAFFAQRASEHAPQDLPTLAVRIASIGLGFFCEVYQVFTRWKYEELKGWVAGLGLTGVADRLRDDIECSLVRTLATRAGAAYEKSEVKEVAEILVSYALDTYLPETASFDEWNFDGLGQWSSAMKISLPVSQWRAEEPSEEQVEAEHDRRVTLRERLADRVTTALRNRSPREVVERFVTVGMERLFRELEDSDDTCSYHPIVSFVNDVLHVPCNESEIRRLVEAQRLAQEQRLATGLLEQARNLSRDEFAVRGFSLLFATFMRFDLAQPERDLISLANYVQRKYGVQVQPFDLSKLTPAQAAELLLTRVREAYDRQETTIGPAIMRRIEKFLLLEKIDSKWKDHLYAMDHLKAGIGLRGYAQLDPKVEYTREARRMFDEMLATIGEEVTDLVLKVRLRAEDAAEAMLPRNVWGGAEAIHPEAAGPDIRRQQAAAIAASQMAEKPRPIVASEHVGRNAPCPCGSGKKFKKCCGK